MTMEVSSDHAASSMQIILEPGRIEKNYWRDLWNYRELFEVLAWRDVSVRYKQTVIGVAWAIIRPVLSMMIFTFVFARLAKLPSEGKAPYALMVFVGMLPWIFFSTALSDASNSLISNVNLISKVYFPRLIIPTATIIVGFIDLLIGFGIMAVMMFWYHFQPGWHILLLPVFVLLVFLATLGPSLWITALNVKYRDFRYVIPFMLQLGVYVSPVGFSSKVVPEKWRLLYSLNPLVGVIDGFRWSVLGGDSPLYMPGLFLSLGVIALFMWVGIVYFRRTEQSFADII
jgi:lipopolysaccharide transport system permease protein